MGGIIGDGQNKAVSITNCITTINGSVSQDGMVGGIMGRNYQMISASNILSNINYTVNKASPSFVNIITSN